MGFNSAFKGLKWSSSLLERSTTGPEHIIPFEEEADVSQNCYSVIEDEKT
jgi:hypothetical protein